MAEPEVRETVMGLFDVTRETPGGAYDPERFLAFLTDPPATGTRTADTFAGRRRLVRFLEGVQLELAVCFTNEEWDRGFTLDEFVVRVVQKADRPDQTARLARKRLQVANRALVAEPLKWGLLMAPVAVGAVMLSSPAVRLGLGLLWLTIVAGVAMMNARDVRYARKLLARVEVAG